MWLLSSSSSLVSMASSSTSGLYGNTHAPPPPTPSNQSIGKTLPPDDDAALSRFLNQLLLNQTTPSLSSLPPRFSKKSSQPPPRPPVISLIEPQQDLLLSAASDTGLFHLTDHGIPSNLPSCVIQESQSLFDSKSFHGIRSFLGFDHDDEDEDSNGNNEFLVFDTCYTELDAFPAVSEYAKSLERVGLEVVELILSTAGFGNPFRKGTIKPKCLMWVSSSATAPFDTADISVIKEEEGGGEMEKGKCYPYVVSLQHEAKASSVMGESGEWIAVDPSVDSVLVMLGDIAQVWSNGRFNKVRGVPRHNFTSSDGCDNSQSISISLLVTLPMDSIVSPLSPLASNCCSSLITDEGAEDEGGRQRFRPFSFEKYAWRVYHDRFPFKDPLLSYHF